MTQNTSPAVMAQRHEPHDSLDFFPTPPWATRALVEHVLIGGGWSREQIAAATAWDPACGEGHMVRPLRESFRAVGASDVHDYGFGSVIDFLFSSHVKNVDWVITNPPFRLAAEFIERGLETATTGVAMLVRTSFIEGVGRYQTLFSKRQPAILAPFAERVPMFKGRIDPEGSSATSYSWLVWSKELHHAGRTVVRWIPPCRKRLDRPGDYTEQAGPGLVADVGQAVLFDGARP